MKLNPFLALPFLVGTALTPIASRALEPTPPAKHAGAGFWRWFSGNEQRLFSVCVSDQYSPECIAALKEIYEHISRLGIGVEIAPLNSGKRELVLSAMGDRQNIAMVNQVATDAPNLKSWRVLRFRPAIGGGCLDESGKTLCSDDMKVAVLVMRDSESSPFYVKVILFVPNITEGNDDPVKVAAVRLLDSTLGELRAMTEIESLEIEPMDSDLPLTKMSFSALPELLDHAKLSKARKRL